jgi:cytidyltransferase-like protein
MTRVYADMVADLFHYGHVEFLRQARQLGDELVVGIHSDESVETYKRRPIMRMEERVAVVESCRYVDEVVPDAPLCVSHEYLDRVRIDIVVHGDDFPPEELERWYAAPLERGILQVVPYTIGVSTTDIIERLEREAARL